MTTADESCSRIPAARDASAAIGWLAADSRRGSRRRHPGSRPGAALEAVRDRALAGGAVRAHVLDVREEFAHDFVLPALKADALDHDGCPTALTSQAR